MAHGNGPVQIRMKLFSGMQLDFLTYKTFLTDKVQKFGLIFPSFRTDVSLFWTHRLFESIETRETEYTETSDLNARP